MSKKCTAPTLIMKLFYPCRIFFQPSLSWYPLPDWIRSKGSSTLNAGMTIIFIIPYGLERGEDLGLDVHMYV